MALNGRLVPAGPDGRFVPSPSTGRDRGVRLDACRRSRAGPKVVSLHGEHDCSTAGDLVALFADPITLDDADLVIDLGDVTFMDASTLAVLVGVRGALADQERHLSLRSPSPMARRVLDACGLSDLVAVSADTEPSPTSERRDPPPAPPGDPASTDAWSRRS